MDNIADGGLVERTESLLRQLACVQPAVSSPIGGIALVNGCAIALVALLLLARPLKETVDVYSRNLYIAPVATSTAPGDALALLEPAE